jgi:hypothetical protein
MIHHSSSTVVAPHAPRHANTHLSCKNPSPKPVKSSCAAAKGDPASQPAPTDQDAPANPRQHAQQQQLSTTADPAIWCQGVASGSFFQEISTVFPPVQWTPADLVKVQTWLPISLHFQASLAATHFVGVAIWMSARLTACCTQCMVAIAPRLLCSHWQSSQPYKLSRQHCCQD